MNAMEQAQTKHWDELSTTAGQLLANIRKCEEMGLINESIDVPPVDSFLADCLLEHVKGEFDLPDSWDEMDGQSGQILNLVSARRTFEGTQCSVCQGWKPQVKTMLTNDAIKEFLDMHKANGSSPQTIAHYDTLLSKFAKQFSSLPTEPQEIEKFLMYYQGYTKADYFGVIGALYKFHNKRHEVTNPVDKMERPKSPNKMQDSLEPEELQRLFAQDMTPRNRAILLVMGGCGLRYGEARNLKFKDVGDNWLNVDGKTGGRKLPLLPEIKASLLALKDGHKDDDPIFWSRLGKPLTSEVQFREIVRNAFNKASITKKACPHTLRRSFATNWDGDTRTLQIMMGHSNLNTTQQYINLAPKQLIERNGQHNPLLAIFSTQPSLLSAQPSLSDLNLVNHDDKLECINQNPHRNEERAKPPHSYNR